MSKTISWKDRVLKFEDEAGVAELVKEINENKDATTIVLSGNSLGPNAAPFVANAIEQNDGSLEHCNFSDLFTGRLYDHIPPTLLALTTAIAKSNTKEKFNTLNVSDNALGKSGAKSFMHLCYQHENCRKSLKHLHVTNCGLGVRGAKIIAAAFLLSQNVSHDNIKCLDKEDRLSNEEIKKFENINDKLELESFLAGRNRLEDGGMEALSPAFSLLSSLLRLEIPQNGIKSKGIIQFSTALAKLVNLQVLNLNDNTLGVEGAKALADPISKLKHLKCLDLGDCMIDSEGCVAIIDALKDNTTLEELNLTYNDMDNETAKKLAAILSNKKNLKKLELNGNQLKSDGIQAINDALESLNAADALGSLSENEDEESDEEDEEGVDDDIDDLGDKVKALNLESK